MERVIRVAVPFVVMTVVSVVVFVIDDLDARTCGYLMWAFAAASLAKSNREVQTPIAKPIEITALKLPWRTL